MALIGKIRKNFWFVLILLGLALAAFVIMDVSSAAGLGGGQADMKMGEVNGQDISYRDFQRTEQNYFNNSGDAFSTRENVWNYYVEKSIVDKEADKLGLSVGRDELMDLQFGTQMSPIMSQNWSNPQTGAVDRTQLNGFKSAIENGDELDPRFRDFWAEQEHQIVKFHKQDKINNLVSKAIYTPTWLAETAYQEQNGKVDFEYVKIPFDNISDADVALEDSDYTSYIGAHKDRYTNTEETRTIEYVVFDVEPTEADKEALKQQMIELKTQFENTTNDSLFAMTNEGFYRDLYYSKEGLEQNFSESIRNAIPNLAIGEVVGPLEESGFYRNIKLLDRRMMADSVRARHILRTVTPGDAAGLENANRTLDSLLTLIKRGAIRFDSTAVKFSQDPGSASKGGQLDYFVQETMVPEFRDACFLDGKSGEYRTVRTSYGVHLIQIQNQKFLDNEPKVKVAFINKPIIPSTETQDRINEEVADLVASHPYLDDMVGIIGERDDVSFDRVSNIKVNDFTLAELESGNTSRDIVRWAFNGATDANDMAPDVFTYTEPNLFYNNKYVLAGLKSIESAGLRSVDNLRDEITPLVRNEKKGGLIASQLGSSDIDGAAAKFGAAIESATGVAFNSRFLPGLGDEPKVIAQAYSGAVNSNSQPIVGNSGVFIVKPTNKTDAGTATNLPSFRNTDATTTRSKVGSSLMSALKKLANVDDSRATFF